jgi:hypothetical protein
LLIGLLTGGPTPGSEILQGVLFGTLFGQISLAAGLAALGPLRLTVRLPLALLWLAAVTLALVSGKAPAPILVPELLVISAAIFLQWMLVLFPLGLLVWFYSLRIAHPKELAKLRRQDQQIGMRQLMILIAVVAGFFGAARLLVRGFHWQEQGSGWAETARVFAMLVVASAVLTLPLFAAALLPQRRVLWTVIALFFSAGLAMLEVFVFGFLKPAGPSQRELAVVFLTLNFTQCAWVLLIVAILRAGGFRLTSPPAAEFCKDDGMG